MQPPADQEYGELVKRINHDVIPEVEQIFQQVTKELGLDDKGEVYIRAHVEDCLRSIMGRGLQLLESYQQKAQQRFLQAIAGDPKEIESVAEGILHRALSGGGSFTAQLTTLISESLTQLAPLTAFITSTANMRMSRAGSMFHRSIRYLLQKCSLPSQGGGASIGRVDVVVPDRATRDRHPERTVLLELKAMHIRERAKSAKAEMEAARGPVWVVTLDDEFKSKALADLERLGLMVYCPNASTRFPDSRAARPLSDLVPDIEAVVGKGAQKRLGAVQE